MSIIVNFALWAQRKALKLLNTHASIRDSGSEMRGAQLLIGLCGGRLNRGGGFLLKNIAASAANRLGQIPDPKFSAQLADTIGVGGPPIRVGAGAAQHVRLPQPRSIQASTAG